MDFNDRQGGQSIEEDKLPAYSAELDAMEAEIHDASRLPHLHSHDEIRRLFPTIPAAPAQSNPEDWIPVDVSEPRESVQLFASRYQFRLPTDSK